MINVVRPLASSQKSPRQIALEAEDDRDPEGPEEKDLDQVPPSEEEEP